MVLRNVFCIARNNSGRPTLMHRLPDGQASITTCGIQMEGWTRSFTHQALEELLCLRCAKLGPGVKAPHLHTRQEPTVVRNGRRASLVRTA